MTTIGTGWERFQEDVQHDHAGEVLDLLQASYYAGAAFILSLILSGVDVQEIFTEIEGYGVDCETFPKH